MKILILGGYGVFGGKLAELLGDEPTLEILIAGRDAARARAFCDAFRGQAQATPLKLDRRDIAEALDALAPDLVVDASGPFQAYGDACYAVITSCIAARIPYLDLADGADFVAAVDQFDDAAKAAGVFVLSGASSFPVLTAAVLREFAGDMDIRTVEGGIAPSPFAGVGKNVIRAVTSYAGAPVHLVRDGQKTTGTGLAESRHYTIAVPGHAPLRNQHFSLVDVPDLLVIPREYPGLHDIWMGAGPVPEILHRALNLMARLRSAIGFPSLVPVAGIIHWVLNAVKFGEHRGGMFIRATGTNEGQPVERSWHLIADGDDGPYIPSMAVAAIVLQWLAGKRPASGARPATRALTLKDFEPLFGPRSIYAAIRRPLDPARALYARMLGDAFAQLPPMVRALHDSTATRTWRGEAEVRRGRGLVGRFVAKLIGFPSAGSNLPVEVTFTPTDSGEVWTRKFGTQTFTSRHHQGRGRDTDLVVEQFGPIRVGLALVVEGDRLYLQSRRWSCFGVPLPRFLMPGGTSFETEIDGRFAFDVEIRVPFFGLIVGYRGTLMPR